MTTPGQPQEATSQPRRERLEELRRKLDSCIDDITGSRADRAAAAKKEFDAAWKELNAEVGDVTLH